MTLYSFPGYDDEPRTAADALQEWIDTQELDLTEEDTEALYSLTHYQASAEDNIRAIQSAADYHGIDLTHSPLPVPVTPFDPNASALKRREADGHRARTGHTLTGYYVTNGGISTLIRTCECAN